MSTQPLVTCITPTYNRFHLLREMYWTWNRQDYENRELFILNDHPNFHISCDDPRVKIVNMPERMVGLGAKRNYLFENVNPKTKYVMPFDDDDLFLPKHISSLVEALEANPGYHRSKNIDHIMSKDNQMTGIMHGAQPFFGASCFNYEMVKDFKFNDTFIMGEDVRWMDSNGITTFVVNHLPTFIYRLGMGIVHASGHKIVSDDPEQQQMIFDKIGAKAHKWENVKEIRLSESLTGDAAELYDRMTWWRNT